MLISSNSYAAQQFKSYDEVLEYCENIASENDASYEEAFESCMNKNNKFKAEDEDDNNSFEENDI